MSELELSLKINYAFDTGQTFYDRKNGILKITGRYFKQIPRKCRGKIYTKNQKRYNYVCLSCGYNGDISEEDLKFQKTGCPACSGRVPLIGVTDMWTTHPELAKNLKNKSDGYKYSYQSNAKVDWICPICHNEILQKQISNVSTHGLFCNQCSDGNSYPNKFISSFLNYFNINFLTEKIFDWSKNLVDDPICKNKYYDFYIPDYNIVVEANGAQHYIKPIGGTRTLQDEQLNDSLKRNLAISNGLGFYAIDCRKSDCNFILKNLSDSGLLSLLNIDCTDKDLSIIAENAEKSYIVECYKLWKDGKSIEYLCDCFKKSNNTIKSYIQKGINIFERRNLNYGKL